METNAKRDALDKLINVCRAGRAGRDLRLVPAFAEIEQELKAQRDALTTPTPSDQVQAQAA